MVTFFSWEGNLSVNIVEVDVCRFGENHHPNEREVESLSQGHLLFVMNSSQKACMRQTNKHDIHIDILLTCHLSFFLSESSFAFLAVISTFFPLFPPVGLHGHLTKVKTSNGQSNEINTIGRKEEKEQTEDTKDKCSALFRGNYFWHLMVTLKHLEHSGWLTWSWRLCQVQNHLRRLPYDRNVLGMFQSLVIRMAQW